MVEGTLQGIPLVMVYIDDILVTGETIQEHLQNLAGSLDLAGESIHQAQEKQMCLYVALHGVLGSCDLEEGSSRQSAKLERRFSSSESSPHFINGANTLQP